MFKVYINGTSSANLLYDPSRDIQLEDPVLTLKDNEADEFTCTILPDNPNYNQTSLFGARVTIDEEETIDGVRTVEGRFRGRIISVRTDMYGRRSIVCEGALGYLNDAPLTAVVDGSLVSTHYYVRFEETLVSFNVYLNDPTRAVTTNLTSLILSRQYWDPFDNPEYSLLDFLKNWAAENDYHLWAAYRSAAYEANNPNEQYIYIRLIADSNLPLAGQTISFGINMLSCMISESIRNSFLTRITPYGAVDQSTGNRVRMTSGDYLDTTNMVRNDPSTSMISRYGIVDHPVIFDSAQTSDRLDSLAARYVNRYAKEGYEVDAKAVDYHYIDSSVEKFKMRTLASIVDTAVGINESAPIREIEYHFNNPQDNVVKCSKTGSRRLTSKIREVKPV